MNSQDSIAQAQTAVESILTALNVACVVCVDDSYGAEPALEDVIAAAVGLDENDLSQAIPELGENIPDDPDVLKHKLFEVWERLDSETRLKRANALLVAARSLDGDTTDDLTYATILSELIPNNKLVTVSPLQWKEQQEELLKADGDQRTLFLFDRDFSDVGGDSEGGIKIIASLLARSDTERLICGLLTHTVTPENQFEQWEALSETHGIPKDRFVVIPKLHLSKDPILFAQTLKFTALCPDFTELKHRTKEIIAKAASTAASSVDKVSIFDLDHIVFQVSAEEGLWEPDMLFRLHSLFHRLESRRLAHEGGTLEAIAAKLRAVSAIPTICTTFTPPSNAWEIQSLELYESEFYINQNYLPLEVGDIFERVGPTNRKRYILLAQPCDLMVRSNGKRHPELDRVPLAEVVCAKEAPLYSEELPYFGSSPAERWYVKLKLVHQVYVCILDLCILNDDGVARLIVEGVPPSSIRPAWKERRRELSRRIKRIIHKADRLTRLAKNPNASNTQELKDVLFDEGLFKGSLKEANGTRMVTYDCKRIRRVSRARAIGLLMAYTSFLGRPAYDRDFG